VICIQRISHLSLAVISVILFILFNTPVMLGAGNSASGKALIVLIDNLTVKDIENSINLCALTHQGALGLMNTRTAGSVSTRERAYVTLGAGRRALGYPSNVVGYNINEQINSQKASELYFNRTGITPYNKVVNPEIADLQRINKDSDYGSEPGFLGDNLKEFGIKAAVLGNGDMQGEHHREVITVLMDSLGQVEGIVDKSLSLQDNSIPGGIATDYTRLLDVAGDFLARSHVLAVQLSDLYRIEKSKSVMFPHVYEQQRKQILNKIDGFIGNLISKEEPGRLYIISPFAGDTSKNAGEKLAPVIVKGMGIRSGLLYSESTRRPGLVSNIDVSADILNYFNVPAKNVTGKPFKIKEQANALEYIQKMSGRISINSNFRSPVIKGFISWQIFLLIAFLIYLLIYPKVGLFWPKLFKMMFFGVMSVPLSLLLLPLFSYNILHYVFVLILSLILSITFAVLFISSKLRLGDFGYIIIITAVTAAGLLIDIATGSNLMKYSLLGYCPVIGARFYGIGNEYTGVLIGAIVVLTSIGRKGRPIPQYLSVPVFAIAIALIGAPNFGANLGGLITSIVTYAALYIINYNVRLNFRYGAVAVIGMVLLILGLGLTDAYMASSPSHFGNTVINIKEGGIGYFTQIIDRKISMNLKLLYWTIWSEVLFVSMIALIFMIYRPMGVLKMLLKRYPSIKNVFVGVMTAALIGMAVNDSGVVTSATSIIYAVMTLNCLVVKECANRLST
jgi:hypothetical protein